CCVLLCAAPAAPRHLHSFPTRRSSDLGWVESTLLMLEKEGVLEATHERRPPHYHVALFPRHYKRYFASGPGLNLDGLPFYRVRRSEEHTSELQSRENLVCRLLLEKKKH